LIDTKNAGRISKKLKIPHARKRKTKFLASKITLFDNHSFIPDAAGRLNK
jgi:hypothetical protein